MTRKENPVEILAEYVLNAARLDSNPYSPNMVLRRSIIHNNNPEETWVQRKVGLEVLRGLGVHVTPDPNRYGIDGKELSKELRKNDTTRLADFPVLKEEEIDELAILVGDKVLFSW